MTPTSTNWRRNSTSSPRREEGRTPAARGAHHRRVRGNPALCREARPRPAARRRPRHLRAALCRAPRPPARAGGLPRPARAAGPSGLACWCDAAVAAAVGRRSTMDELAAELGSASGADDITDLRHVRTSADKRAAEEIANRKPCEDFETFKPLFERVEADLKTGLRQAQPIEAGRRRLRPGDFFILGGITLYVAEVGEPLKTTAGEVDRRLRAHLRQRHREQSAAALASARVLQRPRRAAAGLAGERAAVLRRRAGGGRC